LVRVGIEGHWPREKEDGKPRNLRDDSFAAVREVGQKRVS
jgi:hypothetical protein